jgi:Cu/Ag efflux pump CusA
MAAAAGLAVTLIPVLMGYLIRGKIPDEQNPLNRFLIAMYRPLLNVVLSFPKNHFANCWLDCNSNRVANGTAWR